MVLYLGRLPTCMTYMFTCGYICFEKAVIIADRLKSLTSKFDKQITVYAEKIYTCNFTMFFSPSQPDKHYGCFLNWWSNYNKCVQFPKYRVGQLTHWLIFTTPPYLLKGIDQIIPWNKYEKNSNTMFCNTLCSIPFFLTTISCPVYWRQVESTNTEYISAAKDFSMDELLLNDAIVTGQFIQHELSCTM